MKKLVLFLAALPMAACAGPSVAPPAAFDDLPVEIRHSVSGVVVYDRGQLTGKRVEVLQGVQGESCSTSLGGRTATVGEAVLLARHQAYLLHADGITSLQCFPPKKTVACSESISCSADAFRFLPR
ncbi:MAG TPA: hypothetical protein VNX25_04240 [Verrucomicrobiae bacterium]|nr:hypothetical protein [Verrucomicrobiae bacterium]